MATSSPTDTILITSRKGDFSDPYVEYNIPLKIYNNVILLPERPDKKKHVRIDGYNEVYSTPLSSNQFICNYTIGLLMFSPTEEGKTVNVHFDGVGFMSIPATMVYAHSSSNPDVLQNLQNIIDNSQSAIDTTNTLAEKVTETNTAIANANSVAARLGLFETYDNTHAYQPLNRVYYNGSTYECILTSTGNLPTNTTYWKLIAQAGVIQNINGKTGASVTLNSDDVGALDKATYDPNNDGSVVQADNATKIENQTLADLDNRYSKVTSSTTNGNIKINNAETPVYSHPSTHSADMITDGVTNAAYTLAERSHLSSSSIKNALINGNFTIWQRGASFASPVTNTYTADRWKVQNSGTVPAVTLSRQPVLISDYSQAKYFARLAVASGSPDSYCLTQPIENGVTLYNGQKVTITFQARSSLTGKRLGVDFTSIYGTGGSPSANDNVVGGLVTLTSSFQLYSFTAIIPSASGKTFGTNGDESLNVNIWYAWNSANQSRVGASTAETFSGAGNIDIGQIQVYLGDTIIPFQPRLIGEELQMCQRYFEKSYEYATVPGTVTNSGEHFTSLLAASVLTAQVRFNVRKRIKPTVKTYSPTSGTVDMIRNETAAADQSAGYGSSINSECVFNSTPSGASVGNLVCFHWTADAEL